MGCGSVCGWSACCIILFLVVVEGDGDPVLTLEGAVVKAYNLTSDNRLFCIFDISIRAQNLDPKQDLSYPWLDLEVRKGLHHKLADDVVAPFRQAAGEEAVGLYVQLEDKIAREMRADQAAGSTTVNIFFSPSKNRVIECDNVKVNFEGGESVKVGCDVQHYAATDDDGT